MRQLYVAIILVLLLSGTALGQVSRAPGRLAARWAADLPARGPVAGAALHLRAGRITGVACGGAVATWSDLSGNGNHATQGTEANQPTLQCGVLAGKPVVRFDGSTSILTGAPFDVTGQSGTIIVVGSRSSGINATVFSMNDVNSVTWYLGLMYDQGATVKVHVADRTGAAERLVNGSTLLAAGVFYISSLISDATVYSMFVNGVAETVTVKVGSNTGNWFGDLSGLDNYSIGAQRVNSDRFFLNGDIAELLIYSRALSTGERKRNEWKIAHESMLPVW